jgi:phosphatidylglycerol:prolipoprotein diacylglycerol transferase
MLAYYVHDLSPFLIRFSENFGVRWYGLIRGRLLCRHSRRPATFARPLRHSREKVSDFIIGGAIFGVLLGDGWATCFPLSGEFLQNRSFSFG